MRRWGLPTSIASSIERHHADAEDGDVPVIRLADMLANYLHAGPSEAGSKPD